MRYLLALICVCALGAMPLMGCSETGGDGGTGGMAGTGGGGSTCQPTVDRCVNGTIDKHFPCEQCDESVPTQANACTGTESIANPTSCVWSGWGEPITYLLTLMVVEGDCDVGYDLDSCNGSTCFPGGLAPDEGLGGVDNAVAGLASIFEEEFGGDLNLSGMNQALSDTLCGMTDDPMLGTCEDGTTACTCPEGTIPTTCTPDECAGIMTGLCERDDDDCAKSIERGVITFEIVAIRAQNCANVTVRTLGHCRGGDNDGGACTCDAACPVGTSDMVCSGGENNGKACTTATAATDCPDGTCVLAIECVDNIGTCVGASKTDVIMNLGPQLGTGEACLSGTLGTIPITLGGLDGSFANAVVRMTVSDAGFSDGLLGVTIDETTAAAIAEAIIEGGGAIVSQWLDINATLTNDTAAACNALSATLGIGGRAEEGTGGAGGTGGSAGNGGGGGTCDPGDGSSMGGACINEDDEAVYDCLEFTDSKGEFHTCTDAAAAIGSECVRGSRASVPPIEGCGDQTLAVVACFPDCPQDTVQALADCVIACTQQTTAELCPPGLSDDCVECTGATEACGAAFCIRQCVADTTAQTCIDCRCSNNCTPEFVICSGIPSHECPAALAFQPHRH